MKKIRREQKEKFKRTLDESRKLFIITDSDNPFVNSPPVTMPFWESKITNVRDIELTMEMKKLFIKVDYRKVTKTIVKDTKIYYELVTSHEGDLEELIKCMVHPTFMRDITLQSHALNIERDIFDRIHKMLSLLKVNDYNWPLLTYPIIDKREPRMTLPSVLFGVHPLGTNEQHYEKVKERMEIIERHEANNMIMKEASAGGSSIPTVTPSAPAVQAPMQIAQQPVVNPTTPVTTVTPSPIYPLLPLTPSPQMNITPTRTGIDASGGAIPRVTRVGAPLMAGTGLSQSNVQGNVQFIPYNDALKQARTSMNNNETMSENVSRRLGGLVVTNRTLANIFKPDVLYGNLLFMRMTNSVFDSMEVSELKALMMFVASIGVTMVRKELRRPDAELAIPVYYAELAGPMFPDECFYLEAEAKDMFLKSIKKIYETNAHKTLAKCEYTNEFLNDIMTLPFVRESGLNFDNIADDESIIWTFEEAERRCMLLALQLKTLYGRTLMSDITNIASAICRRGSITQRFGELIASSFMDEFGVTIDLNIEACKVFYNRYCGSIDPENIDLLFYAWQRLLPADAIRIGLIFLHAQYSGLTQFCSIGKAIRIANDFPWDKVAALLYNEFRNFFAAARAVGNNPYYGFRKDLGIVKSTNYKTLAWLSGQILIRAFGQSTLRQYAGWARNIDKRPQLEKLLDDYVNGLEEAQVRPLDDAITALFRESINDICTNEIYQNMFM